MRIAVIGDIHGNIYALKSVINDIETRNVDTIISTGDLVGYMPFPNEVIDLIRNHKILSVKGNHDKKVAELETLSEEVFTSIEPDILQKSASSVYINKILSKDNLMYLSNLPDQLTLSISGLQVMFVHGSPRSVAEYMYEDSDVLEEIKEEVDTDVIVSGHTHLPYHNKKDDVHFLNAGSVGKPKHGNSKAMYLIMKIENGHVVSEFVEVKYETDKMIQAIRNNPYIADSLINDLLEGK